MEAKVKNIKFKHSVFNIKAFVFSFISMGTLLTFFGSLFAKNSGNIFEMAVEGWIKLSEQAEAFTPLGGLVPGSVLLVTIVLSGLFSFFRAPKTQSISKPYFEAQSHITHFPKANGFSDHMAYALGEFSALAYEPCIDTSFTDVFQKLMQGNTKDSDLEILAKKLVTAGVDKPKASRHSLEAELKKGGFVLASEKTSIESNASNSLYNLSTQGFVSAKIYESNNDKLTDKPYLVVAYRGSEANAYDWLLNSDVGPKQMQNDHSAYVHQGFYNAVENTIDSVIMQIKSGLEKIQEVHTDISTESIPIFFTGHSLGGALSLVLLRELSVRGNKDGIEANLLRGGCYTFGAPRVGNYEYFKQMTAPVFRYVNCSDMVPRLPPSFVFSALANLLDMFGKQGKTNHISKVANFLDDASIFRHYGDLRYLTNIQDYSQDSRPELLQNPHFLDRLSWFWGNLQGNWGFPVKSHSMEIYRKKLMKRIQDT